ncbi:MAG: hypothetical protein V7767_15400, partial [Leeuwenhoekiella sp.]
PLISYFRVGRLLYYSLLLFILESYFYWSHLSTALNTASRLEIGFWSWCFMFSFIHIFLVIMDGWSRYQNYKRAKDLFYLHGFTHRIANLYIGSKCQRMAAEVAAEELGIGEKVKSHYYEKGIKWFHYIPFFMVKDPLFLIKRHFWKRTFMEKAYTAQFNYREIQVPVSL